MNLYFQHSNNTYSLVGTHITTENVFSSMKNYLYNLNPNYKIYYIRSWGDDNRKIYDVGSHSEFFILTNEVLEVCQ